MKRLCVWCKRQESSEAEWDCECNCESDHTICYECFPYNTVFDKIYPDRCLTTITETERVLLVLAT